MTSHVHLIIGSANNPLENIIRDLKRHTSEELHKMIRHHVHESRRELLLTLMQKAGKENSNNCGFQLWQQHNHPIVLDTPYITHQKLDYLHNNPVTAGLLKNRKTGYIAALKTIIRE